MKKLIMLLAGTVILLFAVGCAQGGTEDAASAEPDSAAVRGADAAQDRDAAALD